MPYLSGNLKYLLWSIHRQRRYAQESYDDFIDHIADKCQISPARFRFIMGDKADATGEEILSIKKSLMEFDNEHIPYIDVEHLFVEYENTYADDLISENILYLINSIPWGSNQEFIETLQIRGSTLTRWKNGTMKPSKHFQEKICKYFGIPDVDTLKTAYLFLGLSPVSTSQKKVECKRLIDGIHREDFEAIYPALIKLLK